MNGAIAAFCASVNNQPSKTMIKMIGNSQNFFLTNIKPNKSLIKSSIIVNKAWLNLVLPICGRFFSVAFCGIIKFSIKCITHN